MLNTITHGSETDAPPLVIAHGLYGSARNWGVIAKRLSDTRLVVAVDMRNHGHSAWTDSHTYEEMADDLAEVIGELGGTADIIGHSMGGKAAMILALQEPGLVNRLVVADIAPVAYDHDQLPLIKAMQALDLDVISTRKEADEALSAAISDPGVRAFLIQSLDLRSEPRRWKLNLGALADQMPLILGFPQVSRTFDAPSLFLSGGTSKYVTPDSHATINTLFPKAKYEVIPGVGHWLHAEAPAPFLAAVTRFLDD